MPIINVWRAKARSVRIEDEIARRGISLKAVGAERVGPCPVCGGVDRFSINVGKQVFNCRGCSVGGDVIKLVQHLDDVGFMAACETLAGVSPASEPVKANGRASAPSPTPTVAQENVVAEFLYHDETGNVVSATERIEFWNPDGTPVLKDGKRKKTFRQKRPDPERPGEWIYDKKGCRVIPYRLPELVEAVANEQFIVIVEGEAKVDLLRSIGVNATCCAGGASKWKPEHSAFLREADEAGCRRQRGPARN